MSQPGEGPAAPLLGRHRAAGGYRRVVGAHRAPGYAAHGRGYLFTVALLAGTASMPILAAVSAGSATVGSTALPDSSTPFIPTPSVGPVVVPLPGTGRPGVIPSARPGMVVAPSTGPSGPGLAPRAPAPPADPDPSGPDAIRHPPPPAPIPPPAPRPPAPPPSPSPTPAPHPTPVPSPTDPPTPDPTPTVTLSDSTQAPSPPGDTGPPTSSESTGSEPTASSLGATVDPAARPPGMLRGRGA
ncbi:hypothetical protein [Micromonospora sp. CA-111912]|uniref:hypothetical protein n=1 Tax=Micromonospora sp. CA-111912 TaxID=3239955 RepID=UPI003D93D251